jgi:hypothetical protein
LGFREDGLEIGLWVGGSDFVVEVEKRTIVGAVGRFG